MVRKALGLKYSGGRSSGVVPLGIDLRNSKNKRGRVGEGAQSLAGERWGEGKVKALRRNERRRRALEKRMNRK